MRMLSRRSQATHGTDEAEEDQAALELQAEADLADPGAQEDLVGLEDLEVQVEMMMTKMMTDSHVQEATMVEETKDLEVQEPESTNTASCSTSRLPSTRSISTMALEALTLKVMSSLSGPRTTW